MVSEGGVVRPQRSTDDLKHGRAGTHAEECYRALDIARWALYWRSWPPTMLALRTPAPGRLDGQSPPHPQGGHLWPRADHRRTAPRVRGHVEPARPCKGSGASETRPHVFFSRSQAEDRRRAGRPAVIWWGEPVLTRRARPVVADGCMLEIMSWIWASFLSFPGLRGARRSECRHKAVLERGRALEEGARRVRV
jgi:hypothetical protein